jgi:hypothetical protein
MISNRLSPIRRDELTPPLESENDHALAAELASLRAQLDALWKITSETGLAG